MSRLLLEAVQQAKISEEQALLQTSMIDALDTTIGEPLFDTVSGTAAVSQPASLSKRRLSSLLQGKLSAASLSKASASAVNKKKNWESHDVYRAIEWAQSFGM